MSKTRRIQNSFSAGEWSPTAHARTDLPQYQHACRRLKNVIPLLSGGVYNRPGSYFNNALAVATNYAPRIIPFVVSQSEAYCVFLSQTVGSTRYLKVIRAVSNIAAASPSSVTGAHEYKVATTTNANGSYDEVHAVQYAQSVDVMHLVHPLRKPKKLIRTAIDTFTLADFDTDSTGTALTGASFQNAWPYRAMNTTGSTIAVSNAAVGTGRTLTLAPAAGDAFRFNANHVGAVFKQNNGGTVGCCKVTAFVSTTQVTVEVMVAFTDTSAQTTWWESSWSDYRGWPRTVGFFEQRIAYGGNATERDSIWFSKAYNYSVMSIALMQSPATIGDGATTGPAGEDPFQLPLASLQLNLIQWMSPDKTLVIGTMGEEWVVQRSDESNAMFGIDNLVAVRETAFGSHHLQVARAGAEILFVGQNQHEVKALVFNQSQSAYSTDPVQLFYDEKPQVDVAALFAKRYRRIAWDESRKMLWCCDTYGNLFAMTRDRTLNMSAWTSHEMGGWDESEVGAALGSGGDTTLDPAYYAHSGAVIDIAVVPNPVIGFNDIWLVVKRKINGAFQYHFERIIGGICPFSTAYGNGAVNTLGFYQADSCVYAANNYPSSEDNIFNGDMSHLEGESPEGCISGRYGFFSARGSAIASGATTFVSVPADFDNAPYGIGMGLPFDCIVEPLRLDTGSQIGTSQMAQKRIHKIAARFYRTQLAKIGNDEDNTETVIFREGDTPLNKSAELYTGDKVLPFTGDYDRDGYVHIRRDSPLPFALMGIIAEGNVYD